MNQLNGTPLKRFNRDWRRANPPQTEITLILQSVAYPVNVGSLFRIADAAGVKEVILSGITPRPDTSGTAAKVGRNKHTVVPWRYVENAEGAIQALREEGVHVSALEITDQSVIYDTFVYPDQLALILGNEDHGVTRSVLSLCDSSVFVPMYGKGASLNVHVSAAIVLYHIRSMERSG